MMKTAVLSLSLMISLLTVGLSAQAKVRSSTSAEEFLGQCLMEKGVFKVYQNRELNTFKFDIESESEDREVIFDRSLVWLWYEVDASFWKFRNGRHNGVFSWNFNTGIGHLKYVNGEYYYWNLHECAINEKAIAY